MKKEIKDLAVQDILGWIIGHSKDTQAMDAINFGSYPYTSKYLRLHGMLPDVTQDNLDDV